MSKLAPFYEDNNSTIYCGDCLQLMPHIEDLFDVVLADPPYGITSLGWDKTVDGWIDMLPLKKSGSLWMFGSLRSFMNHEMKGWKMAQDLIWEKHNGSNFHADRFRRVHEIVAQFYRGKWSNVYRSPVYTKDATARTVRRRGRPKHVGEIEGQLYRSFDGGPRLMRSVVHARSCHGAAMHPTQKPVILLRPLIEYSCPPGGVVFDPFMGVGSTLVAAQQTGRRAVGIEIDEKYCDIAVKRLAQRVIT